MTDPLGPRPVAARVAGEDSRDGPTLPAEQVRWRVTRRFTRRRPRVVGVGESRRAASQLEDVMPLVNVKVIEGVFSPSQKADMVKGLTEAMVGVEGENMRPVTWVVVEEVKSGDWGIGGNPLTTGDVQALAAGTGAG